MPRRPSGRCTGRSRKRFGTSPTERTPGSRRILATHRFTSRRSGDSGPRVGFTIVRSPSSPQWTCLVLDRHARRLRQPRQVATVHLSTLRGRTTRRRSGRQPLRGSSVPNPRVPSERLCGSATFIDRWGKLATRSSDAEVERAASSIGRSGCPDTADQGGRHGTASRSYGSRPQVGRVRPFDPQDLHTRPQTWRPWRQESARRYPRRRPREPGPQLPRPRGPHNTQGAGREVRPRCWSERWFRSVGAELGADYAVHTGVLGRSA